LEYLLDFAFGYGVREIILQRRHAAARKHFFRQQMAEHERPLAQQEHIDRMKLMATSARAVTQLKR